MIAYVSGIIAAKDADGVIIEAGGIGYEIALSTHALAALPPAGQAARVWTYLQVKEDGFFLFGFSDLAEKQLFCKLIEVSGVGAKTAIAALSTYTAAELASRLASGDVAAITRIPGIGKKTAQRMVLELQGVLEVQGADAPAAGFDDAHKDAVEALQQMGFTAPEIARALEGMPASGVSTSKLIRKALQSIGGAA